MANSDEEHELPPPYFSNLYFLGQEARRKLPTQEESHLMQPSDYEGQRYVVPEHLLSLQDPRDYFERVQTKFEDKKEKDIRWYRKHAIDTTGSDYEYRFWLQYEVEKMAAGERSIKILNDLDNEYETAMEVMDSLVKKFASAFASDCSNLAKKKTLEALGKLWQKNKSLVESKLLLEKFLNQKFVGELKRNDNAYRKMLEVHPLFFFFGRIMLQRLFKSVRRVEFLPRKKKSELVGLLKELGIKSTSKQTVGDLHSILNEQLSHAKNKQYKKEWQSVGFSCAAHLLFDRMVDDFERELARIDNWVESASLNHIVPNSAWDEFSLMVDNLPVIKSGYRKDSIHLSTLCIKLLSECEMAYLSEAAIVELGILYEEEYDKKGNYPAVLRLSKSTVEGLNNGNHPIFRHFQQDVKRNMYCLPRKHIQSEVGKKSQPGGFLYNGRQTVSEPNTLRMYNLRGNIDGYRFLPSADTISALNALQETQWSINIDFLHFIAELTKDAEPLPTPLNNLRHAAWTASDNMRLRPIFAKIMDLDKGDGDTISLSSSISSTLKQARKNLLNAGNVFWHAWFCDWRGRFNTRIDQLGPQGDDLSKALLLFTEWKPMGERGRYWMYVRGYDLFRSILDPDSPKIHDFDAKEAWTQEKIAKMRQLASMLRFDRSQSEIESALRELGFRPRNNKSERFQRVSFLFEFDRIHRIAEEKGGNWDAVLSGFPIHHDASCNGFQHIAALMRRESLAKSVNVLPRKDNSRGDLYREVADLAKRFYEERDEKADEFRKALRIFCYDNAEVMDSLSEGIFTREICKPLVMLAGYGAKDYSSPLFNKEGKNSKKAFGMYHDGKWRKTLHHKSPLYEAIEEVGLNNVEWFNGIRLQLENEEKSDGIYNTPESAKKLRLFGDEVRNYLRTCVEEKTDRTFENLQDNLSKIYDQIDDEDNKNLVRFKWQVLDGGSRVRNIRWASARTKNASRLSSLLSSKKNLGMEEVISFAEKHSLDEVSLEWTQHHLQAVKASKKSKSSPEFIQFKYDLTKTISHIAANHKDRGIREEAKAIVNYFYTGCNNLGIKIQFNPHQPTNYAELKQQDRRAIKEKIKRGLVPNFIHSFDACHMQMVILQLKSLGIHDIWAVHDSFGTHPCHVDELRSIVNSTFSELHSQPLTHHLNRIVKLNNDILKSDTLEFSKLEVEDQPSGWINRVNEAKYLVS